jgi:phosphoglycerate dehydrogenase-like enzyme
VSTPGERPLVLQTEHLHPAASAWLGQRCDLRDCSKDPAQFDALLPGADGLVIRTYTRVDAALLERAPRLRVVGRAGVGLDNVDQAACAARGVRVVHTPDANTQAVAEYVFAMLFDATRPRLVLEEPIDAARWSALRQELTAPRQLDECVLGILGLGRIGSRVARIAHGLGMSTIYHDLIDIPRERRHDARPVSLDELRRKSDVISVHVDPREANRGLVGADFLAGVRENVVIVNTSRGMVIDEPALAAFLRRNPRAAALLDVHAHEPIPPGSPLWNLPNAHLSPHIAAATRSAHEAMSWVVREVWEVLRAEGEAQLT